MMEQVPVEGGETTAEVEAAVIAAANEHGRMAGGQVIPGGAGGEFPEDCVQQEAGIGGRTAAGRFRGFVRDEGFKNCPLVISEEGMGILRTDARGTGAL